MGSPDCYDSDARFPATVCPLQVTRSVHVAIVALLLSGATGCRPEPLGASNGADTGVLFEWALRDGGAPAKSQGRDWDVRQIIREHMREARRHCVEELLPEEECMRSPLSIRITIGADGLVTSAARDVNSKEADPRVEACLLERIRSWKFPAGIEPTTVIYPVQLSSK